MEPINPPTIAKKLWHIVQVVYYMLRKGISKRKLILDLHLLLKRGKLAGKIIGNLLTTLHHHHHHHTTPKEVQFSFNNTPSYTHYFHSTAKRKSRRRRRRHNEFDSFDAAEIAMALRMMNADDSDADSVAPTPSPTMVRQLRITDSPFPMNENEIRDGDMVDEEADKFIRRFYEQLKRQQLGSECSTPDNGYLRRPITGLN